MHFNVKSGLFLSLMVISPLFAAQPRKPAPSPAPAPVPSQPARVPAQPANSAERKSQVEVPTARPRITDTYNYIAQELSMHEASILVNARQCPTLFNTQFESSPKYRRLAFRAAKNCNHPAAHLIGVANKRYEAQNACAGRTYINGHKIVFVDIDEDYFNKFHYGVQSFIMHHEMAHIVLEHRNSKKPGQQLEREADKMAALAIQCENCCREMVQYYLESNKKANNPKRYPTLTLAELDTMPDAELEKKLTEMHDCSQQRVSTHPLDIERALRIYRYSKKESKISGKKCLEHIISDNLNHLYERRETLREKILKDGKGDWKRGMVRQVIRRGGTAWEINENDIKNWEDKKNLIRKERDTDNQNVEKTFRNNPKFKNMVK